MFYNYIDNLFNIQYNDIVYYKLCKQYGYKVMANKKNLDDDDYDVDDGFGDSPLISEPVVEKLTFKLFLKKFKVIIGLLALLIVMFGSYYSYSYFEKKASSQIISLGFVDRVYSFNFQTKRNYTEYRLIKDIFAGLIDIDNSNNIVLSLAKSVSLSQDKKVYTFKINPNAKWSDGVKITSKDFLYAYKNILDPNTPNDNALLFYSIKGAKEYKEGKISDKELGIVAPDESTLIIELESPYRKFLFNFSHIAFYPIPSHIVDKVGIDKWYLNQNMVTSGPYKIASFTDNLITLNSNPLYSIRKYPIEVVKYNIYESPSQAYTAYQYKRVEILYGISDDLIFNSIRSGEIRNKEFNVYENDGISYFIINSKILDNSFLNQSGIRNLIALSINKGSIFSVVRPYANSLYYNFFPNNLEVDITYKAPYFGLSEEEKKIYVANVISTYNINNTNISFNLYYLNTEKNNNVANAIKESLSENKIFVKLFGLSDGDFNKILKDKQYEAILLDVEPYNSDLNYYKGMISKSDINYANYSSQSVDLLLNSKINENNFVLDISKYYNQLEEMILTDSYYIPLYSLSSYFMKKSYIKKVNKNKNYHSTKFIGKY